MHNIYFQFGHGRWWRYFKDISSNLVAKHSDLKISGITTGLDAARGMRGLPYDIDALENISTRFRKNPLSDGDLYRRISEIERKYGVIWRYAYADRQLVTYYHTERYSERALSSREIEEVLVHWFSYFEDVFARLAINTLVTYATASAPFLIASAVIEKFGGKHLQISSFRYPDLLSIFVGPFNSTVALTKPPSTSDYAWAKEYYRNTLLALDKPDWAKRAGKGGRALNLSKVFDINQAVKRYREMFPGYDAKDPLTLLPPIETRIKRLVFRLARLARFKMFNRFFMDLPAGKAYAFFPLHVTPEASVMVLGFEYINQIALIETISRMLPLGLVLCVKEHPSMIGRRDSADYKRLRNIPNVVILKHDIDSSVIINGSSIVLTISGTAGLEAFLLGKPVVTFGENHYNALPGVFPFRQYIGELSGFITKAVQEFKFNENAVIQYLATARCNSSDLSSKYSFSSSDKIDEGLAVLQLTNLIQAALYAGSSKLR